LLFDDSTEFESDVGEDIGDGMKRPNYLNVYAVDENDDIKDYENPLASDEK
jgi:hypothetical protein